MQEFDHSEASVTLLMPTLIGHIIIVQHVRRQDYMCVHDCCIPGVHITAYYRLCECCTPA